MSNISRVKDNLSYRQKAWIKKVLAILPSFTYSYNLTLLGMIHGTDKVGLGYLPNYCECFAGIRRHKLNVLEIGVGGGADPALGGNSLRMWREFFPNSQIYGIDIEDKSRHQGRRIRVFKGDQNSPAFLTDVAREIGRIDIVIDDGSHVGEHVINSFSTLFPLLESNGIYAIEDLSCSYWPNLGGDWQDLNSPATSMGFLKGLTDGLNYRCIPERIPTYYDENIQSIRFFPGMVVIYKGRNDYPRVAPGLATRVERARQAGLTRKRPLIEKERV